MRPTRVFVSTLLFTITLLSTTFAQNYTQWQLPDGAKLRLGKGRTHSNLLNQFPPYVFSPDSTQLAVMSSIGIWLYDVQTAKELILFPMELDRVRWRLAFKPNSNILVCGDKNGIIHFWDVNTRTYAVNGRWGMLKWHSYPGNAKRYSYPGNAKRHSYR